MPFLFRRLLIHALSVWLLLAIGVRGEVVISEFMAANDRTLTDEDREFPDWIELFNDGVAPVNLAGWFLTDNVERLTKWQLPAEVLLPQKHLVIFASGKDRAVVGRPLHTNFRLSASGGYLALVRPDGLSVASVHGPAYPRQFPDISFGRAVTVRETPLVVESGPVRFLVPANGLLESQWFLSETDDSAWGVATNGVGFELTAQTPEATVLTDSSADFSGIQGDHQWYYGYYNRTADTVSGYSTNDFLPFPRTDAAFGAENYWDGTQWRYGARTPPLTAIGAVTMRPNAVANGGFEHWAIRRWVSPVAGTLRVAVEFGKEITGGTGLTLRTYRRGALAETVILGGDDTTGTNWVSEFPVSRGDRLDFVVLPQGKATDSGDLGDLARLRVVISQVASLDPYIRTDLSAVMAGQQSSVWLRIPFSVGNPGDFTHLHLRVRGDDGFAAYLNGVEVAAVNAPTELHWNSTATAATPDVEAVEAREFDLSQRLGLLQSGENLLAIQALNRSVDDPDLLASAELVATRVQLDPSSKLYFSPATPGRFNGAGNTNLGPVVLSMAHEPLFPATNEAVRVMARIARTFQELGPVTLTWRIMYSNLVTVPMLDDGQHGDGAAGDGLYGATIPADVGRPGQMVRWFVSAADVSGNRTRLPAFADRLRTPEFEGTVYLDPSLTNPLPVLHFFVQNPNAADSGSTRASIAYRGAFYDNVAVGVHGQSSREFPKHSYNFDMNPGVRFEYSADEEPVDDFNLLTTYPDKAKVRNMLAYETFRDAGHAYHWVIPIRVQRNGAFLGDFNLVEDGSETYLKRVGLNPEGALYKMYSTTLIGSGSSEKKTRKWENNADILTLNQGVLGRLGPKRNFLYDRVDIPRMVNFLATMIITGGVDCCHKNFYLYHDPATDLWQALPWDLDLTFGRNWTGSLAYYDDAMYPNNGLNIGSNQDLMGALFGDATFSQMYVRRVRTLMDRMLQTTNTPVELRYYERRIQQLLPLLAPDAALDLAKWKTWGTRQTLDQAVNLMLTNYFPARRKYLYGQAGTGKVIPAAQPTNSAVRFGSFEVSPLSGRSEEEFVELQNTNRFAVDISDWQLKGDIEHVFHPGTVIPANGSLYVTPDIHAFRSRTSAPRGGTGLNVQTGYRGQLSARGGEVGLWDRDRQVARLTVPANPTPAQQYLRISEVLFNSPIGAAPISTATDGAQFVELINIGPEPLDLTGVRFTDGVLFSFAGSAVTRLEPQERVVVVRDLALFTARYGPSVTVAGQFSGRLDPDGEVLRLEDRGELVLEFEYRSNWDALTRGAGHALVTVDDQALWTVWKSRLQWRAGEVPGGTPGFSDASYAAWLGRHFSPLIIADPAYAALFANPDGDAFNNLEEFTGGGNPADPASPFEIQVVPGVAPGSVEVRFHAVPNRTYVVEYRSFLSEANWNTLTISPAGAAREVSVPDSVPVDAARYYRVVALAPTP